VSSVHESVSRWRQRAACQGYDPELFFPFSETGPAKVEIWNAKQVCHACPVQWTCLSWALQHGVTDGIWGGSTGSERRAMLGELTVPLQSTWPAARCTARPAARPARPDDGRARDSA
jgi:WhiB family transcriptional regulator, redox-sensing transcriptional regulator